MTTDEYIQKRVQEHYDYLMSLGLNVVGVFAQGSMNYGLYINDENYHSDVDTKAIVLPTLDDLIAGKKMKSCVYELNNEHIDAKDIRVMAEMWAKSNPAYLEILYTKYKVINPEYEIYMRQILNMADDIVNMNIPQLARCISGMSKEKVAALEHPYPNLLDKIEKYGYDPKQLHHIMRLNKLIIDIFIKNIKFGSAIYIDNEEARRNLINIKKGILSLEQARHNAVYYDNATKVVKEMVLVEYEGVEFNSETYNELMEIIKCCVKYNIIYQVKKEDK